MELSHSLLSPLASIDVFRCAWLDTRYLFFDENIRRWFKYRVDFAGYRIFCVPDTVLAGHLGVATIRFQIVDCMV